MTTDGFSCCLLFILKKYKDKEYGDKLPKCIQDNCDIKNVNSLIKDECDKYLTDEYKLVSVDPGKIRPLSMIDENNNFYKYSACKRRFETYTKRCNEIVNEEKIKHNIIEKETELSKFNSKTLKIEEYKKYITNKNKLNNQVKPFYNNILFRKLNFRRFVRTKKRDSFLLYSYYIIYINQSNKNKIKRYLENPLLNNPCWDIVFSNLHDRIDSFL